MISVVNQESSERYMVELLDITTKVIKMNLNVLAHSKVCCAILN